MPVGATVLSSTGDVRDVLAALVTDDGSGTHPLVQAVHRHRAGPRDLADMVHHLCTLHGRQPGVLDHALNHCAVPGAREWLADAAAAFSAERAYLVALVAAAGPLPSTPGQAEAEAALFGQQHALAMLAQSDRVGCALGAAAGLVLDWPAIRAGLDVAAARFGVEAPSMRLPSPDTTLRTTRSVGQQPSAARAMQFGAQQLIAQHRGLWSLLQARSDARGA